MSEGYDVACPECGAHHRVGLDHVAWKCACGRLWYLDPAGRLWGTEAIKYAHATHGYFGEFFDAEGRIK